MNPASFFLLVLSLGFAVMSVLVHGWTLNGIVPALLATTGGFWQLWMECLRHRSWLEHRDSGFAPGTQHLALAGMLGWSAATFAALAWAWLALRELR